MGEQTGSGTPLADIERSAAVADDANDSARVLLAGARPDPPLAAPLARARLLGAMFGDQSTAGAIGRYRIFGPIGAGGMGVVYEAYDPDLGRGVAIKLVRVATHDRDAALAEAKVLARLSHPNVVPIYDVGLDGDHVYLVMELVRGETLQRWSAGRSLGEILAVFQQAGSALAAAHERGLVHRDFKPDNAIVGGDGRVRVVDFGLACRADDPAHDSGAHRPPAGTPGFMAPEIKAGAAITPAADQYSFCVALAEAFGRASEPMPRWIAAALERGRTDDPARRFASMAELLRILARDPARTRRRIVLIGSLAVGIAALAYFAGRQTPSAAADPCQGGSAELDAVWSPTARAEALDRLGRLGPEAASLRLKIEPPLHKYVTAWIAESRQACLDSRRGVQPDSLAVRRMLCLTRGSDAFRAVGEIVSAVSPDHLLQLPRAVLSMPDLSVCSSTEALLSEVEPPPPGLELPIAAVRRQIAQGSIQIPAGHYDRAIDVSRAAVAQARGLEFRPALAEALLVLGHAQTEVDSAAAEPILQEAVRVALASRMYAVAVEAWARLVYVRGTLTDPRGAASAVDFVEPLARSHAPGTLALALLYNNLGTAALGRGQRARARGYFQRASAVSHGVTGPIALELVKTRANLGLVTDDKSQGDRLIAGTVEQLTEMFGQGHPDTLEIRELRGTTTIENLEKAEATLAPVCGAYEQYATHAGSAARCWLEVAMLRWDLGRHEEATAAMTRAHAEPVAASYLRLWQGDARAATQQFTDLIAAAPPRKDEPDWDSESRAMLQLGLGRARATLGDRRGARAALEQAIAVFEPYARANPAAQYERYLRRARVDLAAVTD
jgi:serine/threonine protein kinase/tetratricopeptide (TPR) repeat protein